MVRDVASIARYLGTQVIQGTVDDDVPVDSALPLSSVSVLGHTMFTSLAVADEGEILTTLTPDIESDKLSLLRSVVIVSHDTGDALLDVVQRHRVTAILGAAPEQSVLVPLLSALLAADQSAEDRAVTTAVRVLTLAARRSGVQGVLAELAHRIDGWVVLLDRHGDVISTAGAGGLHIRDAVTVAMDKPVRVRNRSLQVHSVGPGEDISARLVVAPRTESSGRGRELGSQTAALLDLLLRTYDVDKTDRLGRAVMIDALLSGGPEAEALLREWGVYEPTLTGFALASRSANVDVERLAVHWLNELGATRAFTTRKGVVGGFLRDDHVDGIAERVEEYSSTLFLGIGQPTDVHALRRTADQARQALAMARADVRRVVRYRSIPTVKYVFDQLDRTATSHLASLLDPLLTDRSDVHLIETLRVFLEDNGAWSKAAADLGIHRQTLASRIHSIEDTTGLSMKSADDRTAAWLALRALTT